MAASSVIQKSLIGRAKVEQMMKEESDVDAYLNEIGTSWPDCTFTAPDGRKFAYLFDSRSIALRMLAKGIELTKPDKLQLKRIAGAIVEVGADEQPIKFSKLSDCDSAYIELHRSFGVPLSHEECEIVEAGNEPILEQGNGQGYLN